MCSNIIVPLNLILEVIMLGLQGYAFNYNRHQYVDPVDVTFLSIVPVFLALSIGWCCILTCIKHRCSKVVRILRIFQGITLLIIGSLMIASERSFSRSRTCRNFEQIMQRDCQLSLPKIMVGVLTILDGIVYFLRPQKRAPARENQALLQHSTPAPIDDQIPIAIGVEIATDPTGVVVDGAGGAYQTISSKPLIGFPQQYQQPFQQPFSNVPLGSNLYYENPPPYFEGISPPQNPHGQQPGNSQIFNNNYPSANYGTTNQNHPSAPQI
ncbi:unnamed protein product [Allacma fusca]|uniref:Transmembrane protein n=1 Tax=Allacma fusca TaxID=39272 RepID=A0A8J2NP85_9HEXA|nr:unnamed protein product [Allacma fusca]